MASGGSGGSSNDREARSAPGGEEAHSTPGGEEARSAPGGEEARSAPTVVAAGADDAGCPDGEVAEVESGEGYESGVVSVPVEVPVLWHADWESWHAYFAEYCARTMQVLPVRETMSRAERNRRLKRTKKGEDDAQLIPDGFDPYQRVYICTHGWKKRKSKSEGARPRQHIRLTDCPFRFCIQWNMSRRELQVKNGIFRHNHQVSGAAFATYPSSRGVGDALVSARVQGMLDVGAKRSKIYDYLLEHDQNVIQSDVDNLVREHSSSVSSVDDDDATARAIAALDPENASSVAETNAGESGVISLASVHMRRVYSRFSELLMVDCTHKTNRYNYQLLTFMAMNEFGEGAVVQHSLLEANGDWHMDKAIAHFKRCHPTRIHLLRVIVVDKDLNEIRVLESNFPDARVLICHFHVIKYLKEKRSKPEYGKISGDDASQIDAAIHSMVYAISEDAYDSGHSALRGICERIGFYDFLKYFERNWDASQDRWVMYRRAHLPHFKNHTNNRLESFFGKLKDGVDGTMSMSMCVRALTAHDRRAMNEYQYRISRIGTFTNSSYDEEMATVLRFTTHFVAGEIEGQYARALEKADSYTYTADTSVGNVVIVGGKLSEHRLCVDNWRCTCEFASSMKLPCRHAIAYRKAKGTPGMLIPFARIDARWTSPSTNLKRVKQFTYDLFDVTGMSQRRQEMVSHSEKYREAVRATHLFASELADIQDYEEFSEMLKFLMDQWRNVRQRKRGTVSLPSSQSRSDYRNTSEENKEVERAARQEFGISSSDEADNEPDEGGGNDEDAATGDDARAHKVTIRLNPRTRKVGAPKKPKKTTVAGERADRKWFAASESGRKTAGEVTLARLLDALEEEQPNLHETQRRLSGIIVKYVDADKKKPKYKTMKNPVLILDPFYMLPPKLLDACVASFPVSNTKETAISVDASQGEPPAKFTDASGTVEFVQIKDVGNFSRSQIEIFKKVSNLKACVQLGRDMHKWLTTEGIPALPAEYHEAGKKVALEITSTYPHKRIETLPDQAEFEYSILYRATLPTWLTDASIRALCLRLASDFPACRFAGFQSCTAKTKRTRSTNESVVANEICDRVIAQARETGVDTVMLPLNFKNAHWCCVVVKVGAKRIYYYDPLNQAPYRNAAQDVATHLKISGMKEFDVISLNNPIQFDAYSCGVYVCWMFIRQVAPGPPLDMSANALTRRRFELFYYLLTGHLLPFEASQVVEDDGTENKMPVPAGGTPSKEQDEDNQRKVADEAEEVPPTQVTE